MDADRIVGMRPVETALAAAREILKTRAGGSTGEALITQSISDLRGKLN